MNLKTIKNFYLSIVDPWLFIYKLFQRIPHLIPDKVFISVKYRVKNGRWPNLKNPQSFTEKINWLKLYNRKPEYTQMVDKYAVKKFVASRIGADYIIPTLGVWDMPEQIEWDSLPNQFVLKTTHSGGSNGVVVCTDKSKFDKESAITKLNRSLKSDIYMFFREWPYKDVPRRIIAEQFMKEENDSIDSDLSDYKFFCFNGEPKYCQVIRDRRKKETIDFYDMEWKHMPFVGLNPVTGPVACNGITPVTKPLHIEKLIEISRKLSKGIPFTRVDLYVINNSVYFGEITFYPASGYGVFTPAIWDKKLGELIKL